MAQYYQISVTIISLLHQAFSQDLGVRIQMEAFVYLDSPQYENNHCLLEFLFRFEYLFNFDNTFEIHDDIEVLKRMGMAFGLEKGQCAEANLRASRTMVPKALEPYVMGKFARFCFINE